MHNFEHNKKIQEANICEGLTQKIYQKLSPFGHYCTLSLGNEAIDVLCPYLDTRKTIPIGDEEAFLCTAGDVTQGIETPEGVLGGF